MLKFLVSIALLFVFQALLINNAQARITPEDILNSKKAAFEERVRSYSPENKQKLDQISKKIHEINKLRTDQLTDIMHKQGLILDEYQRRVGKETPQIEKARYWVTFAHEAIAYQAAKIYVFNLNSESSIKSDILSTINLFSSELNYARSQALKSQKILKETIQDE